MVKLPQHQESHGMECGLMEATGVGTLGKEDEGYQLKIWFQFLKNFDDHNSHTTWVLAN